MKIFNPFHKQRLIAKSLIKMKQLIGPFTQLLTLDQMPLKGALKDSQLNIILNGGLMMDGQMVSEVGSFGKMLKTHGHAPDVELVELKGKNIGLPGFIDCHTHICFEGSRAGDYALRNAGSSYLEIAKKGGGIWDTVGKTRAATQQQLVVRIVERAKRHFADGITTIEVKSGYGLSVVEELKMLRAIQQADALCYPDLISTCLAAHIKPKDFDGDERAYLDWISQELLPIVKQENLSNRIDAFVEYGAFGEDAITTYFKNAQQLGFSITVHADQFHVGGSKVAAEVNAVSADHLEASTDNEINWLAESDVVATALPGASIGLGCAFAPARKLLDAGACLAIASDWNPGSAPMGDLLLQAAILGSYEKLSNAEVLSGITYRAAHALRMTDRGVLASGKKADLQIYAVDHYNEILYHQGRLKPAMVWKNGQLAHKI
ncbi:MAG: imidazolonepropionase [Cyclobacteriaceae bacterium]